MHWTELETLLREAQDPDQLDDDPRRTDALLIYNPTAGPRGELRRDLERVLGYLGERGWHATIRATRKPGDATELARAAVAARCKAVLVAGGDGTIHEAVNGLVGSDTALGVLPAGTGNVWAKEIGLPTLGLTQLDRLLAAARMLVDGEVRWVEIFRLLESAGYSGCVSIELEDANYTKSPEERKLGIRLGAQFLAGC